MPQFPLRCKTMWPVIFIIMSFREEHPHEQLLIDAIREKRFEDAMSIVDDGADPRLSDENGLNGLDYAQLTGNVEFFTQISRKTREINVRTVTERFPDLCQTFLSLPDFQVTFDWAVRSWVPFVSGFCPSDKWVLTKVGSRLRIDTTLANWSGFRWTRGSLSIFFDAAADDMLDSFLAIDGVSGDRVHILREIVESAEIDKDIATLMKLDLIKAFIQVDKIRKVPAKGWFRRLRPKTHDGRWTATPYDLQDAKVKFLHYYWKEFGKEKPRLRRHEKTYSARLWCSTDFPVQPGMLTPFLEALAPSRQAARNVLELLGMFEGHEGGMPVKGEVRVFPTVRLEFQFVNYSGDVDAFRDHVIPPPPSDTPPQPYELEPRAEPPVLPSLSSDSD